MPKASGDYSPTIRRRRLSEELKSLRQDAGMTLEEAAARLEWSRAKVANIETGKRLRPYVTDIGLLLNIYGVEDDQRRQALLDLTRQSREKGWWTAYGDFLTGAYIGLEVEAATIATYQVSAVPGLLQTADYAAASAAAALNSPEDVERIVAARMRRQQLFDRAEPPQLWAIIDEAALARPAGNPGVMRAQIEHLVDLAQETNTITVQVLPFEKGLHAGTGGPFVLLDFPDPADRSIVYLETRNDGLYLEQAVEIADYRVVLDHLQATALSPAESLLYLAQRVE